MKTPFKTFRILWLFCLLSLFVVEPVLAQEAPPTGGALRIRSLSDLRRDFKQRAPGMGNRTAKPRDWGVFDVSFDTAPEWIDTMTITYLVLLHNDKPARDERPMSLFRLTAEYRDVARGRDRKAGVVLPPQALERFGAPIGFAAQIFVAGELVAEQSSVDGSLRGQQNWWKNPAIMDSPVVQQRDGYLVERSKSVFNLVDIDAYEAGR